MKKMKAFLTASIMVLTTCLPTVIPQPASALDSVNIMPIGDSITFGLGEDGGYRKYLDYTLRAKGIAFDMVGAEGRNSESFNYNGQTVQYDGNHCGYSGYTIKQQYPIPSWGENGLLEKLQSKNAVAQAQPDIVLLIIGTNDMTANRNLNDCEQNLHTLIDYILGDMHEGGIIFMGSIPEFTAYGGNEQRVGNYNKTVKKVAESYGENVQFADVHGSLNGMADMSSDNLHPSGTGYEKMGKFWAEVIADYLENQNDDPNAPENPEILYSDFETGLSGWQARGAATVAQTTEEAAEGSASAAVTGRTASWNGIAHSLSSKKCPADTHISVQARVLQKTGQPVVFKLTMQYDDNGTAIYDTFAERTIADGEWFTISVPDYIMQDAANPVLYVETDTDLCDFYLDEVLVMKTDGSQVTPPRGDINGDGSCTIADALLLHKWLRGMPDEAMADWQAADLNGDGKLTATDLTLLKRLLLCNPNL